MAAGFLTSGVPLVFYLPAVVIVTLFCGWRAGLVALVAGTLLAWFLFVPPVFTWHLPDKPQGMILLLWAVVAGSQILVAQVLRVALQRVLHSDARYRKLLQAISGTVWTMDDRGEIHTPQPGWTNLTGMTWPAYQGRQWQESVHSEDRERLTIFDKAAAGEFRQVELRLWNAEAADWRWFVCRCVAMPRFSGDDHEWVASLHDIHEHRLATDRRDIMIGELRHRLKNLLTIIDALAKSSRPAGEAGSEVEGFLKRFLGRLHALGAAADLVLAGKRIAVDCGAVVRATLSPFMEDKAARFLISGPQMQLSEQTGGTLGLAIHELATNALKYGALSTETGRVSVHWSVAPMDDGDERVEIEWKERGGPRPTPPEKEGFGTRLIRSVPARERKGEVHIDYESDGLCCRIAFLRKHNGPPAQERIPDAA
jgi:PAS domain S-box-containing protein